MRAAETVLSLLPADVFGAVFFFSPSKMNPSSPKMSHRHLLHTAPSGDKTEDQNQNLFLLIIIFIFLRGRKRKSFEKDESFVGKQFFLLSCPLNYLTAFYAYLMTPLNRVLIPTEELSLSESVIKLLFVII